MATSVITAVQARWASIFNGASDPALYFDEAPQADTTGAQERLPYGVLRDEGLTPEYQSDDGGHETGEIVIELYAVTLADLDALVHRAKWGASAPSARAGLDWFGLSLTTSPRYQISLRRTNERRMSAGFDFQGKRCHRCDLVYEVTVGIAAAGY